MKSTFARKILVMLGIIFAIILIFVVIIIFLNRDINKRIAHITQEKQQLTQQTDMLYLLSVLREEQERAAPLLINLATALPSRDELIQFPRELDKIAQAHKVNLGFGFGSESKGTDTEPGFIRFTMTVSGTPENLIAFLEDFEANKNYIHLASVDLHRQQGETFILLTSGEIFTR